LTQLNLDRYNRVSTTDTRLIRRIVRDAAQRGYPAAETIHRWESVRRGEKRYIFPYQENADVTFNSALVYEGSALAPLAEPLLRQVAFGTPEHVEAKRLLRFLEWFLPVDPGLIPDNSILREFLGGSILTEFAPGSRRAPAAPNQDLALRTDSRDNSTASSVRPAGGRPGPPSAICVLRDD
jgi:uridine kinase